MHRNALTEQNLAKLVAAVVEGRPADDDFPCDGPVYVAARRDGRLRFQAWRQAETLGSALRALHADEKFVDADALQICLTGDAHNVAPADIPRVLANAWRGLRGIEITWRGVTDRTAPTQTIATNRSFERTFDRFLRRMEIDEQRFFADGGVLRRLDARQFLVTLLPSPRAIEMFRGNRIVDLETVSQQTVADMIRTMGAWLFGQVGADGRMTYKYWPSRGEYSGADNTVRQFMATICLSRLAARSGEAAHRELAQRNLDHNLARFFREQDGIGVIEYDGKAKLGAAALAALAILESGAGDRLRQPFELLCRGIEALWSANGSFRTFHVPAQRNDNQNFYPGEALLFWALLYRCRRDETVLARCLQTFFHYRDWHRDHRNPAFIPWHTQACAILYDHTGEGALRDFVFEMNDWLLPLQQVEGAPCPDLRGRFYDPRHPEYGPPHASSTGVYLEGLADALRLAETCGEQNRAERYRKAIRHGVRNIRQLQFADAAVDGFYISKKERVMGAVRTETYNNEIRIDNVQHALMALCKIEALCDVFPCGPERRL